MSSGFVSENDIAEAKKLRQEEWEKVRTADQPIERPEEPFESRSLFDRLKEQKNKKDMEFEEAHKLKNLIRGLEDDEVQFLDLVDQNKMEAEKRQQIEEAMEMKEFRERVATLQEHTIGNKIQSELSKSKPKLTSNRPSQKSLLGSVLRKRNMSETDGKLDEPTTASSKILKVSNKEESSADTAQSTSYYNVDNQVVRGALRCVGILPGIGRYYESSDSEMSSDSEEEVIQNDKFDLVGRKRPVQNCRKNE